MKKIFLWIKTNRLAILLFFIFLTIYIIAWNRGLTLLYIIASLSLATLVISFIAPYFNLLDLSISIEHPKVVHQDEKIPITIIIKSSNFFKRYFLEIWWKTTFSQTNSHMFFVTKLDNIERLNAKLLCDIRGTHKTEPLYIQTSFPLGIKTFYKVFEETSSEILVLPIFVPISKFSFSIDESSVLYGNNISERKGGHDEFISVREYKAGDSPRYIHWATSAKQGELMVREYQDSLSSSLTIVLDLNKNYNVGVGKESSLEYAITIASSLAIYALDKGYRVTLLGYGKEKIELIDILGSHNHTEILRALAYAKCDGVESYEESLHHLLSFHKKGGTLILFGKGNGKLNNKIDFYSSQFFKPVLFDIEAKSFTKDIFNKNFKLEESHRQSRYTLQKGCDIARMFR